jgi:carbon storage regulator
MLIISRKKDQKIVLADDIEITILEVGRNRVRFGIKAPRHIQIHTRIKTTPTPEQPVPAETVRAIEADATTAALAVMPPAVAYASNNRRLP